MPNRRNLIRQLGMHIDSGNSGVIRAMEVYLQALTDYSNGTDKGHTSRNRRLYTLHGRRRVPLAP
jgi:hypothetical protein